MTADLRQMLLVLTAAASTIVLSDLAIQQVYPLPAHLIEAEDGVAEIAASDPETILIGSSHSRSFTGIAGEVARSSGGARRMVPIAVEYGKMTAYEWLLDHRLGPLLDAKKADGSRVRPGLRRLVVATEWWDLCSLPQGLGDNVPARLFTLEDFLADAARHGLTTWNTGWVDYRMTRLLRASVLYQDRGFWHVFPAVMDRVRHRPSTLDDAAPSEIRGFQRMVESGASDPRCRDGVERAALERILDWAQRRGLDTTFVLVPRRPDTLSELARATTLPAFARDMKELAAQRSIRLLDYTTSTPLESADFQADLDHIRPSGNLKFSAWALENGLGFLLEPAREARP